MPDAQGNETPEEAVERIRIVRATQIFGDTPTDPTIGDVVVPAHDEEAANVAAAEVAVQADEDEDSEAAALSSEEAKRQNEALGAEDVEAAAEDEVPTAAADKVEAIEAADSTEEVDRLANNDDRVTVERAAEAKREELSE